MATINGNDSGNIIVGTNAGDVINAKGGNDTVLGGNGNDTIDGGSGNDLLSGGNGNDTILGGSGTDILSGDNGNDTLDGGSGSDLVSGGNGNDLLIYRVAENAASYDIYDGGSGQDTLRIVVSAAVAGSAAFQSDIAQLRAKLSHGSASDYLESIGLLVTSIERLEVVIEGNSNQAPTDIALTNNTVAENATGAVIGTLSTVDPNAGDTHTYTVSDSRFEVVGGQLKLKAGESLNFEAGSAINVNVTSKDSGNLSITETFTINVTNVNEAPTDISLSATRWRRMPPARWSARCPRSIPMRARATPIRSATTGSRSSAGTLKLKAGVSLNYEVGLRGQRHRDRERRRQQLDHRDRSRSTSPMSTKRRPTLRSSATRWRRTPPARWSARCPWSIPMRRHATPITVSDSRFEVVGSTAQAEGGRRPQLRDRAVVSASTVTRRPTAADTAASRSRSLSPMSTRRRPTSRCRQHGGGERRRGGHRHAVDGRSRRGRQPRTYTGQRQPLRGRRQHLKLKAGVSSTTRRLLGQPRPSRRTDGGRTVTHASRSRSTSPTSTRRRPTSRSSATRWRRTPPAAVVGTLSTIDPDAARATPIRSATAASRSSATP